MFCLEDNRNTSVYVFITEIIWRNNWRSIIDIVERVGYNVEKSRKLLNIFITNSRMSTGSCHIAIEEIPGGKGNDFGK